MQCSAVQQVAYAYELATIKTFAKATCILALTSVRGLITAQSGQKIVCNISSHHYYKPFGRNVSNHL